MTIASKNSIVLPFYLEINHFLQNKSVGKICALGRMTPKVNYPILPKFKLVRACMPVLIISNFDDDSIKTEGAIVYIAWRHHFFSLEVSNAAYSIVSSPISPKFELVRYFMHVLVTCKYIRIG